MPFTHLSSVVQPSHTLSSACICHAQTACLLPSIWLFTARYLPSPAARDMRCRLRGGARIRPRAPSSPRLTRANIPRARCARHTVPAAASHFHHLLYRTGCRAPRAPAHAAAYAPFHTLPLQRTFTFRAAAPAGAGAAWQRWFAGARLLPYQRQCNLSVALLLFAAGAFFGAGSMVQRTERRAHTQTRGATCRSGISLAPLKATNYCAGRTSSVLLMDVCAWRTGCVPRQLSRTCRRPR